MELLLAIFVCGAVLCVQLARGTEKLASRHKLVRLSIEVVLAGAITFCVARLWLHDPYGADKEVYNGYKRVGTVFLLVILAFGLCWDRRAR